MTLTQVHIAEHLNHKLHYVAHMGYLVLVFFESHGYYGYVAGLMSVVILIGTLLGSKASALEVIEETVEEIL